MESTTATDVDVGEVTAAGEPSESFSLELSHYEPVPPLVQQRLVAQYKVKDEE